MDKLREIFGSYGEDIVSKVQSYTTDCIIASLDSAADNASTDGSWDTGYYPDRDSIKDESNIIIL